MKISEGIYDVYEILRAHSKDKDFVEEFVASKFNKYRGSTIQAFWNDSGYLSQLWYENHPPIALAKITSGDDPSITLGSITLGKGTVARPIYLPDTVLPLTITRHSRQMPYSWIEPETLFNMILSKEEFHPNYGYCFLRGTDLYIYPYVEKVTANGIFENPMEVQIMDPSIPGYRDKTIDDPYPLDIASAQEIVLQILTKDYAISAQQLSDTLNDGTSKLNILPATPA